jgi:alpha-glucoside transport system permease protein
MIQQKQRGQTINDDVVGEVDHSHRQGSISVIRRIRLEHLILVVISLLWLIPTVGLLVTSFRTRAASSQSGWWAAPWTGGWTVENYGTILGTEGGLPPPGFAQSFINTVIITIPSTIIPIAIAALAAFGIVWVGFRGRNFIYLGVIALLIIPLQVTWTPVLQLFNWIGTNTPLRFTGEYYGLVIAHTAYGLPFAVFLLVGAFAQIPKELVEAARIDGASNWQIFSRVLLPLTTPVLASLAIFQFVWVWNDLMNALIFLQDVNKFPLTVAIRNLLGQYGNEWHLLAAGAFVSMVVPLIVFFSLQRYFVRGLTAGAVKG